MGGKPYTKDEDDFIKENYFKILHEEMPKHLIGKSVSSIRHRAKRIGLPPKTTELSIDSSYFKNIDTPNKAWVLGFWIADGCISKNGQISFSNNEKYLIEFVKQELKSSHKIGCSITGNYKINTRSNKIKSDLISMGFNNKKSHNSFIPKLNPILHPYLIRGIFDGDGSVGRQIQRNRKIYFYIQITGTQKLLKQIKEIVPTNGGNITKIINETYRLQYVHSGAWDFANYIYQNPLEIYHRKKYQRYLDAINEIGIYAPIERNV